MFNKKNTIVIHWLQVVFFLNCGIGLSQTTPEVSPLSGEKAYAHVQRLVSFGPRPPASPGIKKSQAYLTKTLKNLHLDVEHQNFLALTPNGNPKTTSLINPDKNIKP